MSPFQSKHLCHFITANLVFQLKRVRSCFISTISRRKEDTILQDGLINETQINIKLLAHSPILHFALAFLNLAVSFEILVDLAARFPT